MEQVFKHYVGVIAYINMTGQLKPLYIVWNEGVKYKIDLVYRVFPAASQAGGGGILYECKVAHKRIKLYQEKTAGSSRPARPHSTIGVKAKSQPPYKGTGFQAILAGTTPKNGCDRQGHHEK